MLADEATSTDETTGLLDVLRVEDDGGWSERSVGLADT